jgi:hypothetical protein
MQLLSASEPTYVPLTTRKKENKKKRKEKEKKKEKKEL